MLVTPAPIVAYIVCFTYLDSSTIKSQLPELVHSFTGINRVPVAVAGGRSGRMVAGSVESLTKPCGGILVVYHACK